jgi:zinc/manganese transport system substrate-binding protein
MRSTTITALAAASATIALALTGCSAPALEDDGLSIVASTNVYGSIAHAIAGDRAEVTNIIDSPAQDPHSYEASARDRLAISKADIVIVNGEGYDSFIEPLLAASPDDDRVVIDAVEASGFVVDGPLVDRIGPFNEHVWYSIEAMRSLAARLAQELSRLDPDNADAYDGGLAAFDEGLDGLSARTTAISEQYWGLGAALTEPVAGYLIHDAGLFDQTIGFGEAIEEGRDVPPRELQQTLDFIRLHMVKILVVNEQTTSPEVEQVVKAAEAAGVPVMTVTETLPAGTDYLDWMSDNVTALETALEKVPQ